MTLLNGPLTFGGGFSSSEHPTSIKGATPKTDTSSGQETAIVGQTQVQFSNSTSPTPPPTALPSAERIASSC